MKLQRRLASQILNCSPKKIVFDDSRMEEIGEAITNSDVRRLIGTGAIIQLQKFGVSRSIARKRKSQKAKGRLRGQGSRKGLATARGETQKRLWINKVRLQRSLIKKLKKSSHVNQETYRDLYNKIKGGFFRSKRHVLLFLEEKDILKSKDKTGEKK
ncbi:50S ribosomal protein L19e [Candidatus Woesearchaeota archaeon]|nr:50S ribosomal protein L19e [Candidatus Woesearchaeota archaeon]